MRFSRKFLSMNLAAMGIGASFATMLDKFRERNRAQTDNPSDIIKPLFPEKPKGTFEQVRSKEYRFKPSGPNTQDPDYYQSKYNPSIPEIINYLVVSGLINRIYPSYQLETQLILDNGVPVLLFKKPGIGIYGTEPLSDWIDRFRVDEEAIIGKPEHIGLAIAITRLMGITRLNWQDITAPRSRLNCIPTNFSGAFTKGPRLVDPLSPLPYLDMAAIKPSFSADRYELLEKVLEEAYQNDAGAIDEFYLAMAELSVTDILNLISGLPPTCLDEKEHINTIVLHLQLAIELCKQYKLEVHKPPSAQTGAAESARSQEPSKEQNLRSLILKYAFWQAPTEIIPEPGRSFFIPPPA